MQIYLNKDRKASEALLKKVTDLGASAVIFTVDTAWKSKRTRDVRAKASIEAPIKDSASEGGRGGSKAPLGISAAISGYQDTNLTWGDIDFIRVNTIIPSLCSKADRAGKHTSTDHRQGRAVRGGCGPLGAKRGQGGHPFQSRRTAVRLVASICPLHQATS